MKKTLLALLFCIVTLVGYSQTSFSEFNHKNISASIDSLQNEYNYLNCCFQLYKLSNDLHILSKDIDIQSNSVEIKYYHNTFYKPLYDALVNSYNSKIELLSSYEKTYPATKVFILKYYDNFSTTQKNVIDSHFDTINASFESVYQSLKVLEITLDLYKNK